MISGKIINNRYTVILAYFGILIISWFLLKYTVDAAVEAQHHTTILTEILDFNLTLLKHFVIIYFVITSLFLFGYFYFAGKKGKEELKIGFRAVSLMNLAGWLFFIGYIFVL